MSDRYNVFDYCLINSHVHNLNSAYKILSIILFGFGVVIANSIIDMVVLNFFLLVVMIWSNVSIRLYFKGVFVFKGVLFSVFLIFSLIYLDIFVGLIWCLKLIDVILYISIITMTTSFYNIVYGVEKLLCCFKRFIDVREISLKIGLGLIFFRVLYGEYNRVKVSKWLRGVRFENMGFIDKLDSLVNGFVPVYYMALRRLSSFCNNMYVRGYGICLNTSNYRLNKWGKTDTIMLVINVMVNVIIFIY